MNILILGSAEDAHGLIIEKKLLALGVNVAYLDTRLFPSQIKITWEPIKSTGALIFPLGKKLNLVDINKIFWRTFYSVKIPSLTNSVIN